MAHGQKSDFVFRRNGRVHLNRRGHQFSRLLAAEVCASAVVMLETPCSEVVWRVLATHSIRQFPLHFPSRASPCAVTFQLDSNIIMWPVHNTSFLVHTVVKRSLYGRPKYRDSNSRSRTFVSYPKRPEWLCSSRSQLFNLYRVLFPRVKSVRGRNLTTYLHPVSQLRMRGATHPFSPHTCSRRAKRRQL
jgi:hypothetical protein